MSLRKWLQSSSCPSCWVSTTGAPTAVASEMSHWNTLPVDIWVKILKARFSKSQAALEITDEDVEEACILRATCKQLDWAVNSAAGADLWHNVRFAYTPKCVPFLRRVAPWFQHLTLEDMNAYGTDALALSKCSSLVTVTLNSGENSNHTSESTVPYWMDALTNLLKGPHGMHLRTHRVVCTVNTSQSLYECRHPQKHEDRGLSATRGHTTWISHYTDKLGHKLL